MNVHVDARQIECIPFRLAGQAADGSASPSERVTTETRNIQRRLRRRGTGRTTSTLLRVVARLQFAHRQRSCLLAAAGHDLRQPLQVLSLALEHLQPVAGRPGGRDWSDVACRQIDRLADGLTRLARSAREDLAEIGAAETLSLSALLRPMLANWQLYATARGNALVYDGADAVVVSNPELLTTMLGNILGNAVRYTEGGEIRVTVRAIDQRVVVEIADTVRGMDAETITSLFKPKPSDPSDDQRLGMGLSIVGLAARLLDHPVKVASRPGSGTCFSIELPCGQA